MVKARDAIRVAREMIGTPYSQMDCIGLIVRIVRTAPGGDRRYRVAGTNALWNSAQSAKKYRDLTWRQEGVGGARAGMLAFKRDGENVHHTGIVTGEDTVIHSSSAAGRVLETALDGSWDLLAAHRCIEVERMEGGNAMFGNARVETAGGALNLREGASTRAKGIAKLPNGARLNVLRDTGAGWLFARTEDGLAGYVSADYVAEDAPEDAGEQDGAIGDAGATTLVRSDGAVITLGGRWRVAED